VNAYVLITSNPQTSVGPPSLELDAQDRPVVFWSEQDSTNRRLVLRMKRWLGSQWGESLDVSAIPAQAGGGAFAIDEEGQMLCAHPEYDGVRNVVSLKRFNR
jgi:hypothetical protein